MKNTLPYFISLLLIGGLLFLQGCDDPKATSFGTFSCDAETLTEKDSIPYLNGDGALFELGFAEHDVSKSFEGNASVRVEKTGQMAFGLKLENVISNQFIEATVWRYDTAGLAGLVIYDTTQSWVVEAHPIERREDGWEKLQLRFTVPPNIYKRKLFIGVTTAHAGNHPVWFDNMTVTWSEKPVYPEYANEEKLEIYLPKESYEQMKAWRDSCHAHGRILKEAKTYYNGALRHKGVKMPIQIRLKGDVLDHVQGFKWSFRVKVKGSNSVNGMKSFALEDPTHRHFMDEWLAHKACEEADILTTKFDFIPITLNDKPLGVYVLEEHFEKQLVEHQNRREGPILKYDEEAYWEHQQHLLSGPSSGYNHSIRNAAAIVPYKKSRLLASPALTAQFSIAKNELYAFHYLAEGWENAIDFDRTAKYVALSSLMGETKNMAWHNQRWYYNPVMSQLEPIAHQFNVKYDDQSTAFMSASMVLENSPLEKFEALVNDYQNEYFNATFRQTLIQKHQAEYDRAMALLEQEFGTIHPSDWKLRNPLPNVGEGYKAPEFSKEELDFEFLGINGYLEETLNDSTQITLLNNHMQKAYEVIGTGLKKSQIVGRPEVVEPLSKRPFAEKYVTHKTPATKVFYTIQGEETIRSAPIYAWKRPEARPGPVQELLAKAKLDNNPFYTVKGDSIFLKPGLLAINEDLVFPKGYQVVANGPNQIVLNNGAGIFSWSPVHFKGTAENMIKITSTDGSGQGLTVLHTGEGTRSSLDFVEFESLNTVSRDGWTLTGAVTFYESDVSVNRCKFMYARCEDALNCVRSDFEVNHSMFFGSFGDAFDADFCSGKVLGCAFNNIGNDAIDFSGSQVNISACEIINSGDKGISGGENSQLVIQDVMIDGGVIAIASKDLSTLTVSNVALSNNQFGFAAFRKKAEYGPASITVMGATLEGVIQLHAIETGSLLILDNDTVRGAEDISKYRWYQ